MIRARSWCAAGIGSYPTIRAGIVSAASIENAGAIKPAPDNHFTACPNGRVTVAGDGRASSARRNPTLRSRIVSRATVKNTSATRPTPNNHLTACPNCRVARARSWCAASIGSHPTVRAGIVSAAGIEILATTGVIIPTPDNHFTSSPNGSIIIPPSWCAADAGRNPTVRDWSVSTATVKRDARKSAIVSAPDDHFSACPNCGVTQAGFGHAGHAGRNPTVRDWSVSTSTIETVAAGPPTPHDHFTACPNGGIIKPRRRRAVLVCRNPSVRARIVFPASCCYSRPKQSFQCPSRLRDRNPHNAHTAHR